MSEQSVESRQTSEAFLQIYNQLLDAYQAQNWWPADTEFEVMVGAVLTQNASWKNVEYAIDNLREANYLDAQAILNLSDGALATLIRPSGYFNVKAKRLKAMCEWFVAGGGFEQLNHSDDVELRHSLLEVHGIGPETADDIMLYAFQRPVFVVDAYTRRIFHRLGLLDADLSYESIRQIFESLLPSDVACFNEYHALIVRHAKVSCAKKPRCDACVLARQCLRRGV